jgi:hypothetical protein
MDHSSKVDTSLKERRGILKLLGRLRNDAVTFQEMEQIGVKFRQAGRRALRPLVRELARESSGELITRYAYLLDFFETESWLDQLVEIAATRRDLGDDGKAALLVALEGYGVDVHSVTFNGAFSGIRPLSPVTPGAMRLEEDGIVTFLDDFLCCPSDVQKIVIRELSQARDPQGIRMLEAILWHEDREIVRSALAALGRIRNPGAADVLRRFIEDGDASLAGEAKRSLRRLLFVGIQAPPPKALLPFHEGYVSAPDGEGYRSLLVSRWVDERKLAVLYLQVHDRRGLLAAWGTEGLTLEEFESELDGFCMHDDLHRVTAGHVLELLRDALYHSSDFSYLPADFYMRRGMFAGEDLTPAPYRPVFAEPAKRPLLSYRAGEEISRELFADPFFAGWFIAAQRVYEFAEEYRRSGAAEHVLERFCSELLAPDLELIRERLLASADLLRRVGREASLVKRVVALAASLGASPLPHHLHPFLRVFALESMQVARDALAQGEEDRLSTVDDVS